MLQQETADDYVIATNETRTVREFVEVAFAYVDIKIQWKGQGVDEVGIDIATGKEVVKINSKFFRPAEVDILLGDPSKAEENLGWNRDITFLKMVERMVENDLRLVTQQMSPDEE
jgi:GDPmannose 4,6-dehydratase